MDAGPLAPSFSRPGAACRSGAYAWVIAELPSGVVTLLFSDIEGSTSLLKRTGDAYDVILEAHCDLVRSTVSAHGGIELSTEGDSFFVVFRTASSGIACAVAVQRALRRQEWPADGVVRVRIGLHTGPVRRAGRNYVGMTVHEAARIASAAHGGQIVVSEAAAEFGDLPEGVSLRSLGSHSLKDIDDEFRLFQVCHADLQAAFPALRSAARPSGALPSFASAFVGRAMERAELAEMVRERRVITIVGPPGVGKTRLAIEVARDVADERRAGARLVELGTVADPGTVAAEVGRALGVRDPPGVSSEDALVAQLASTDALIIIDNCEHVADEVGALV